MTSFAILWIIFSWFLNSVYVPTRGIITSGCTSTALFFSSTVASKIPLDCISVISGYFIPKRQPRCPSMGLNSCNSKIRLFIFSAFTFNSSARLSIWLLFKDKNSCSGGSRSRIVVGFPSMTLKISLKSSRWNGSNSMIAFRRSDSFSAKIIFRIIIILLASKNICSVRHNPIPSAPNVIACCASFGLSAFVLTFSVRTLSAHFISWR